MMRDLDRHSDDVDVRAGDELLVVGEHRSDPELFAGCLR